jgi:hypothetical protein
MTSPGQPSEKCPECEGDGVFMHSGNEYKCSVCHGTGRVNESVIDKKLRESAETNLEIAGMKPSQPSEREQLETIMVHYMGEWFAAHHLGDEDTALRLTYEFHDKLQHLIRAERQAAVKETWQVAKLDAGDNTNLRQYAIERLAELEQGEGRD